MDEVTKKMNAEVVAVFPNKIKISVDDLSEFIIAEEKLRVGSYLEVSDNENAVMIAIVENYAIEVQNDGNRKYIIEAVPLGTLSDGKFNRGGDSLAIPPKEVKPATKEQITQIYISNIDENNKFLFSTLAQDESIKVPVDGNKFFNKHIAIVGSTGSGKSCTVAKIIKNATNAKNGNYQGLNNSHIVIFDIHSEYKEAFSNANIIDISDLVLPYWLLNGDELEELFLEVGDNNNYNQSSVLRSVIIENKKIKNPSLSKVHFDSPVKFDVDEVLTCLINLRSETRDTDNPLSIQIKDNPQEFKTDEEKIRHYFGEKHEFEATRRASKDNIGISKGVYADGTLNKFISRFESKIKTERLSFLFGDKSKNISFEDTLRQFLGYKKDNEANITIIDLSSIPFEVLSITVSLITRILFEYGYYYKRIKKDSDVPVLLVFEEAHKYVPKSDLARYRSSKLAIERIAKEGRKYGVTLLIASQRPSEISETIFSQCNNFVAMRLTNPDDQNYVKRLLPDTLGSLTDSLPALKAREALIIGEAVIVPTLVKIDECDNLPSSSDVKYLDVWKEKWKEVEFDEITKGWLR